MEHFKVPVAVVVLIQRVVDGKRQLLLQRRQNTGFGDGMWDFACSGHVEEGETLTQACVRECYEELGIQVKRENIRLFTLIYKRDGQITYLNPYLCLTEYYGNPCIKEPEKCSALEWFDESALPANLLPDRMSAYRAYLSGQSLVEYGWD